MNLNGKLLNLEEITGHPVEQDTYEGDSEIYITFTYEDERAVLEGDNRAKADTAYLQISLFCPKNYNYFADKDKIRDYLESWGCKVSIRTWLETGISKKAEKIRRVLFQAKYTESRKRG